MRGNYLIITILVLSLVTLGCAKKKKEVTPFEPETSLNQIALPEQIQQPITVIPSDETLSLPPAPVLSEEEQKLSRNKQIQEALKIAGYYQGEIDGKIGPKTNKAIREFQAAKGLVVDGIVGSKTWAELEKVLAPQTTTVPSAPPKKN